MNPNMADLFGKMNEFQQKMQEAKDNAAAIEVNAEVGGGMVKVTANGNRQIVRLKIEPDVIDPNDADMLEDLIIAGVNKALAEAERAAAEKMQEVARNMLPGGGLPGMDLSKFGL
ncbi:MAG: YbaB/EbfC family nucleoid-associated protein [Candidatus Cyclonatronum sp.]|uniref:YbaB/EbfC family nucleoid-associated protein n=1 Tax=Cyclonatronum sp. TaxID=3024185 RepID=UPI0025BEC97B|nr:YbaB/EbfC family nucleoid-associated protein [Cyclonatronum sp.]MCH8485844.1 YbaB/EbfC family nucleoid-associated protein [Cyclonatronum sp.]